MHIVYIYVCVCVYESGWRKYCQINRLARAREDRRDQVNIVHLFEGRSCTPICVMESRERNVLCVGVDFRRILGRLYITRVYVALGKLFVR